MRKRIGVIMGGFSSERHVSLESGRNIYHKLVASLQYEAIPLFLSGSIDSHRIFVLPIALLLKDNADDIHDCLLNPTQGSDMALLLAAIRQEAHDITQKYAQDVRFEPEELTYATLRDRVDFVFIALHGRPGEDGTMQRILESYDIPYNGSGIATMALTMDKFATNQLLQKKGFHLPKQFLLTRDGWLGDPVAICSAIEATLAYPMIAKPVDDGCSTGVVKIIDQARLLAYISLNFQVDQIPLLWQEVVQPSHKVVQSSHKVARPSLLLEEFIAKDSTALHCLETTTALLTQVGTDEAYEVFEPSEVLAVGEVLSLEEKFLAGEGQNITPARFHVESNISRTISQKVKEELAAVARAVNIQGYARIDAFVKIYADQSVEVWVIEINALPAMTPATCIFHQAALNGYTPFDLIDHLIQYGLTKKNFTLRG